MMLWWPCAGIVARQIKGSDDGNGSLQHKSMANSVQDGFAFYSQTTSTFLLFLQLEAYMESFHAPNAYFGRSTERLSANRVGENDLW